MSTLINRIGGVGKRGPNYATIDNAALFDGSTGYLSRTPASAGNLRRWTVHVWVKRSDLSAAMQGIFGDVGGGDPFYFETTHSLKYSGATGRAAFSTGLFRDPSAWMPIAIVYDIDNTTASDRIKLFRGGEQLALSTYLATAGTNTAWNTAALMYIGRFSTAGSEFGGYLADFVFLDGIAADGSLGGDFLTATGAPKAYAGPYGTNGFHLKFNNAANLGEDSSGNGNDWTVTGTVTQVTDTPTNNVAILSPVQTSGGTFFNGARRYRGPSSWRIATVPYGLTSGKWYVEAVMNGTPFAVASNGAHGGFGFWNANLPSPSYVISPSTETNTLAVYDSSWLNIFGTWGAISGAALTNGDVVGWEIDLETGTWRLLVNGVLRNSGTRSSTAPWYACAINYNDSYGYFTSRFSEAEWSYTPPTGFKALTSANLPKPDHDPREWFNAVGYSGNGSTLSITGNGSQPDLTWIKNRSAADSHVLTDVLRGVGQVLSSNSTAAETTDADTVTSFDVDGFSIGADVKVNTSAENYISWNWQADGAGVTNTDGTITSTVSVAAPGHFSIATWICPATAGNFGHGLPGSPELIIRKATNLSTIWAVWHRTFTASQTLYLSATNSIVSYSGGAGGPIWGASVPDETLNYFRLPDGTDGGAYSSNGQKYIDYSFRSVPGICKVCSYNGSADGPVIDCGFRPRWIMSKRVDSTGSWQLKDTARDSDNVVGQLVQSNASAAEVTFAAIDILSSGFKVRTSNADYNASGGTYIFLAMADLPFANTDTTIPLAF